MASALAATVSIILQGVNRASGPVGEADTALEQLFNTLGASPWTHAANDATVFRQAVLDLTNPLATLAIRSLQVNGVIAGLGTALAGIAFTEAKATQSALLDLQKVLDDSEGPAEAFTESLNKLAIQYGENGNALVASMANFRQSGFVAEESSNLVKNSLDLMVAGELEAAESSELLVSILKGFKAPASEAGRVVDILNEVSNNYSTSVRQLGIGLAEISPIAAQMNFSFEDTVGILTPVIEVFRSGNEAADGLKTGLLKLIDDSKPVQEALDSIGVAQRDANGNLRNGKDILLDVAKAFVSLDKDQKLFVTSQLVGIEQSARMVEVFDALAKSTEITIVAQNAAGSAAKEVATRLSASEVAARRTSESFRQLASNLGTQFRDEVTGVVAATGELAQGLANAAQTGRFDAFFAAIKPQLSGLETLFRTVAQNIDTALAGIDYTNLAEGLRQINTELGDAFEAVFGTIDLTTVDGLQRFLQLVVDRLGDLAIFSAGALDQMEPLFDVIGLIVNGLEGANPELARFAGEISGMSLTINELLPRFLSLVSTLFSIIGTIAQVAFNIGLLVVGFKLLQLAGISLTPILTGLTAAIGRLSLANAALLTTLLGIPGALAAATVAAGALGVAIGSGLNVAVEKLTGQSISTWAGDAVDALTGVNQELEKFLTEQPGEEALAQAREARLRRLAAAAAEEQKKFEEAAKARIRTNQQLIDNAEIEFQTNEKLIRQFAEMGFSYDTLTGKLTPLGKKTEEQNRQFRALGTALQALDLDIKVLTNGITKEGQVIIDAFDKVASNAEASADVISKAFDKSVSSTKTRAELDALRERFLSLGKQGKLSAEQIQTGLKAIADQERKLISETDALKKAFADAGLTMQEDLDAAAESARQLLDLAIQENASLADRTKAYENYAEKMRKAYESKTEAQKKALELDLKERALRAGINESVDEQLKKYREYLAKQVEGTKVTQGYSQSVEDTAAAQEQANNRAAQGTSLLEVIINLMEGARAALREYSDAAADAFDTQLLVNQQKYLQAAAYEAGLNATAQERLQTEIARTGAEVRRLKFVFNESEGSVGEFINNIVLSFNQVKLAFLQQEAEALRLADILEHDLANDGVVGLHAIERASREAQTGLNLLGDEELQPLLANIERAEARIQSLFETVDSRLEDISDRFDEVFLTDAQRARQEYEQDLAELQDLQRQVREAGDTARLTALRNAEKQLKDVFERELDTLKEGARDETAGDTGTPRRAGGGGGIATGGPATPFTGARDLGKVTIALPDGEEVDLFADLRDAERLTRTVRDSQRNTLGAA